MKKIFGILVIFCVLTIVGCTAEDDAKPPKVRIKNSTSGHLYGIRYAGKTFFSIRINETTEYKKTDTGYSEVDWLKIDGDNDGTTEGGVPDLSTLIIDFDSIQESDGTWSNLLGLRYGELINEEKFTLEISEDEVQSFIITLVQD